jgi:hypothetical protein
MTHFDFNAPAEVFAVTGRRERRHRMTYRRFQTGAEAIRHAMEVLSAEALGGTIVETDEERFGAAEIRTLYESSDYPLARRKASRWHKAAVPRADGLAV